MDTPVFETNFDGLTLINRGKVRDVYAVPERQDCLLFVATDRISAYDHVMHEVIPGKGIALTQMSLFWFRKLTGIANHLLTANVWEYPPSCQSYADILIGRSMLVKKATVIPIECIVRGRLTGSYWNAYKNAPIKKTESPYTGVKVVCGINFETNLMESDVIVPPLFTPSTKAEHGKNDENISFSQMESIVGHNRAIQVRDASTDLFVQASAYALERGIVIADTKFEFGIDETGQLLLIDEVLTPDSSRFWPADQVALGYTPPSFDKQFLRDWLSAQGWDKKSSPPQLSHEVIDRTAKKYSEAFSRLTTSII